ncbi:hypothetical protein KBC77_01055 [Candidatus Saccharibacteria bacterium]|nr:hypothetical protein [Candidatus Saccharibacteria bacterium]
MQDNNQQYDPNAQPQVQWTTEQWEEYQRQLAAAQAAQSEAVPIYPSNPNADYAAAQEYTDSQWAQPLASTQPLAAPVPTQPQDPNAWAAYAQQPSQVDQQIYQEYSQMNTFAPEQVPKSGGGIWGLFGFVAAHKILMSCLVVSLLVLGTLGFLFFSNYHSFNASKSTSSSVSEDSSSGGTSSDSSGDEEEVGLDDTSDESDTSEDESDTADDESDTSEDESDTADTSDESETSNETETTPEPATPEPVRRIIKTKVVCEKTNPLSPCYVPPAPPAPPS